MLKRQIDVSADLLAFRHRRQDIVGDRRGIQVEQANPRQAVDSVQLSKEAGERTAFTLVDAVEARVLRNEQELADAAIHQGARLADD
jgi:hypothetical protein